MSIKMDNDQNIPINTDACFEYYEQLASQEEVYLEEIEEEVVTILTAYVSSASQNDRSPMTDICVARESDLEIEGPMTNPKINPRMAGDPEAPLVDASEELITGDADDPPLSEEVVQEMLPDSPARGSGL